MCVPVCFMYSLADCPRPYESAEAAGAECWTGILTLLVWRIDFSPQKPVFQVVFWAVQVRVQAPILHPDIEKQTDDLCYGCSVSRLNITIQHTFLKDKNCAATHIVLTYSVFLIVELVYSVLCVSINHLFSSR